MEVQSAPFLCEITVINTVWWCTSDFPLRVDAVCAFPCKIPPPKWGSYEAPKP